MSDREFVTTRQAAQRLGVSLGTVQHMVESGALEAWKTLGGHRRIPIAALEAHLGRRRSQTAGTSEAGEQLDILIAEDDTTLQKLYQLTMERWEMPINLRMVDNGFDGLMQVGQRIPDVLITDLVMPGMDGFEMIRRLRQNSDLAHMDILVVSALDKEDVLSREDFPNNITVFGKPIPFHEIKGFLLGRLAARERRSA
jgi:excisionase family DNA binding protein